MFEKDIQIRVRYADTDRMGYVYYGKYAEYFEVGRVEALRALGFRYRDLENEQGVMLPVASLEIKYKAAAHYDDLLTVRTRISSLPTRMIAFEHEILNEEGELLTEGVVKLVFVDIESGKSTQAPSSLMDTIKEYFEGE